MASKGHSSVWTVIVILLIIGGIMECREKNKEKESASSNYDTEYTYDNEEESSSSYDDYDYEEESSDSIYGTWYWNGGMAGYVIFNEDGTCKMKSGDFISDTTFTYSDSYIYLDGLDPLSYEFRNGDLIVEGETYTR